MVRTGLAILILSSVISLGVARADDTPPQGMPLTKGGTNPAGDYVTHYTYGPPLATYTTNGADRPTPTAQPAPTAPVIGGEGSNGTPGGTSGSAPTPGEPSR